MPWVPLDIHYADEPEIQAAGELTPFALSVFPFLLAKAKARAEGGRVEVTFRDLAHSLFISTEEAEKAVLALVETGVVDWAESAPVRTCPQRSADVRFSPEGWRRRNEGFRKQEKREAETA